MRASERGASIRRVPFEALTEAITSSTTLVAVSHVRSNGGGMIDLDRLSAAARQAGATTLIDATHSAGVLPIAADERELDFVVAAAYKHLPCPRGVAAMSVSQDRQDEVVPGCASWRAQSDPYTGHHGGDLDKLSGVASRFDVSLAWLPWVGARESLAVLTSVSEKERQQWCVDLADDLAAALDVEATGSSVLGVDLPQGRDEIECAFEMDRVVATCAEGTVRVSFQLYNDAYDVAQRRGPSTVSAAQRSVGCVRSPAIPATVA